MIFGAWLEILSGRTGGAWRENKRSTKELTCRDFGYSRDETKLRRLPRKTAATTALAEIGDLFVQVGQGGFEGFTMVRVRGVGEIVGDAGLRELQIPDRLFTQLLLWGLF